MLCSIQQCWQNISFIRAAKVKLNTMFVIRFLKYISYFDFFILFIRFQIKVQHVCRNRYQPVRDPLLSKLFNWQQLYQLGCSASFVCKRSNDVGSSCCCLFVSACSIFISFKIGSVVMRMSNVRECSAIRTGGRSVLGKTANRVQLILIACSERRCRAVLDSK